MRIDCNTACQMCSNDDCARWIVHDACARLRCIKTVCKLDIQLVRPRDMYLKMTPVAMSASYTGQCLDQCWLNKVFSSDHTNNTVVFVNYR